VDNYEGSIREQISDCQDGLEQGLLIVIGNLEFGLTRTSENKIFDRITG
jgi:hypothetical protein